jgi:hypothetical protein
MSGHLVGKTEGHNLKTIAVVIPVENHKTLSNLLDCIAHNIMMPNQIVLINNTSEPLLIPQSLPGVKVEIINPSKPLSINASWRHGFKIVRESQLICMFHDDILISYDFFRKIRQASNEYPMASVYCPAVEKDATRLNRFMFTGAEYEKRHTPQDCCFVLRGEFLRDLPIIPHELTTYFGAAWIHFWTSEIWRRPWITVKNALAFHHDGDSMDTSALYETEQTIFEGLKHAL